MAPTTAECLHLLREHQVPEHIIEHSRMVVAIATLLCGILNRHGKNLNEAEAAAASWLHDIAKWDNLHSGENHSLAGAKLLAGLGYAKAADIVRQHVVLDPEVYDGPIAEAMIVHYADKRVRHSAVVSLKERFQDLKARYGKTPEALTWLETLEHRTRELERRIFEGLPISPEALQPRLEQGGSHGNPAETPKGGAVFREERDT